MQTSIPPYQQAKRIFAVTEKKLPSPELLRKLLRYEPETGKLFWLYRLSDMFPSQGACNWWNTRYANKEAFSSVNMNGYKQGAIFNQKHQGHRVIWALKSGEWPILHIDHVDGNKTNNTWSNLRLATSSQNNANRKPKQNSSSSFMGVFKRKDCKRWQASISVNGKTRHLGLFETSIEAAKAYDIAAKEIHGNFARLNLKGGDL